MKKKNADGAMARASRRDALLDAATRLMREKGYAKTTTRDLARAVGMGSGSPFCHFRRKEAILATVARHGLSSALDAVQTLRRRRADAHSRLREMLRLHAEIVHGARGDAAAVALREWRQMSAENRRRLALPLKRYEIAWREALAALHPPVEPTLAARLLLGALNWSIHWHRPERGLSPRQLADAAFALFVGAGGTAKKPR